MIKSRHTPPDNATSDAQVLALQALAAIVGDDVLRERFLALTGVTGADVRERAGDPAFLGAVLDFAARHQPTLIQLAGLIGCTPEQLAAAARRLGDSQEMTS